MGNFSKHMQAQLLLRNGASLCIFWRAFFLNRLLSTRSVLAANFSLYMCRLLAYKSQYSVVERLPANRWPIALLRMRRPLR